ncbi:MAG: DUF1674 domain-containing protein [Gammaproteobacteria bacterium]
MITAWEGKAKCNPEMIWRRRTIGETPVVQAQDRSPEPSVPEPDRKRPPEGLLVPEIGGPKGPEPTRYGDWERRGRCIDF